MTQPISTNVTSFATEIAALLIENESNRTDTDQATRDAARTTYLKDAQEQVDALHAAAAAEQSGALMGAAFNIAGDGLAIGAADCRFDAATTSTCDTATIASYTKEASCFQTASTAFKDLSGMATSFGGGRAADDDKADAKRYETLAEQAKWQASDATTDIDKVDKLGDKILDIVQSLNQAQDSATNAVIGRI